MTTTHHNTRITNLTPQQKAAMPDWAEQWINHGLDTTPVNWQTWEQGARDCYRHAGIPWPSVVVRVSNPFVLSLAAPIAAWLIERIDRNLVGVAVGDAVGGAVGGAVGVSRLRRNAW